MIIKIVAIIFATMMKIVIRTMISKQSGAVELCILQELVISQWHNQCICSPLYLYCVCILHKQCICFYTLLQCTASAMHPLVTAIHCISSVLKQTCALEYFGSAELKCRVQSTVLLT